MPPIRAFLVAVVMLSAAVASAQSPEIPIVPGVNVVVAVANDTSSAGGPGGVLQGDYELVVSITNVSGEGITHLAYFDGVDAAGIQRRGSVSRVVTAADLASAPTQIFGFHLSDPPRANGATALGPSLDVTRALVQQGSSAYAFRLWVGQDRVSGTLRRSSNARVRFPVLLNGKRVELDAVHATGQMALGSAKRPFETVILDHPRYPLSLRIAYGARDGGFPFKPEFARDIVRIDFPVPQSGGVGSGGSGTGGAGSASNRSGRGTGSGAAAGATGDARGIADALNRECRVELSGIYFDFNQATLQPQSERALKEIATALKSAKRRVTVEGHTDNIGSDRYNDDLSSRRAATVKTALVRDYGVDEASLLTTGFGERRPIDTNDTLLGRAHNRRVELACGAR